MRASQTFEQVSKEAMKSLPLGKFKAELSKTLSNLVQIVHTSNEEVGKMIFRVPFKTTYFQVH